MHIRYVESNDYTIYMVYTYPLVVQSIPSLPNLYVRWKLAAQGDQDAVRTSWTPSLIFSALEPHPAADSNRTCSTKSMSDDSQPKQSQYHLQFFVMLSTTIFCYVVTTPELLAVFC